MVAACAAVPGGRGIATGHGAAGALVPLYTYPTDPTWGRVLAARQANPLVPVLAIANPASGAGNARNPDYVSGIDRLQQGGVAVLGYVDTAYGRRRPRQARLEIYRYWSWYRVAGIFFDQMANTSGKEGYYADLSAYAASLGMATTVGNPGTQTRESYLRSVDVLVLHDSAALPDTAALCGDWHSRYPRERFATLSYGVASLDAAAISRVSGCAGFVHVTNDSLPNPWDSLPPYFESLVGLLASL